MAVAVAFAGDLRRRWFSTGRAGVSIIDDVDVGGDIGLHPAPVVDRGEPLMNCGVRHRGTSVVELSIITSDSIRGRPVKRAPRANDGDPIICLQNVTMC
jgi:hypothetical protein